MNKYKISCSACRLQLTMLLATRPSKCPSCKEYFRYGDVDDGQCFSSGVIISDSFATGGNEYIHAEGDCSIQSNNDIIMGFDTVVTAIKGAKVDLNNPTIDKAPQLPEAIEYKGILISPPKIFILKKIIIDVIGVKQTLAMSPSELQQFFNVVRNRIANGYVDGLNGGALTGIGSLYGDSFYKLEIIDTDELLTTEGVCLLKFIATGLA